MVMWENLTDPILTGRELQGIPKMYADIPDHTVFRGVWRASASYRGHKIVDLTIKDLKPLSPQQMQEMAASRGQGNWMGWRYIPNPDGKGAALSHATLFPTSGTLKEAWVGTGEVRWNRLTWEQNPTQSHIVNALQELPILEYRSAMVTKTSTDLAVPMKPVRALR